MPGPLPNAALSFNKQVNSVLSNNVLYCLETYLISSNWWVKSILYQTVKARGSQIACDLMSCTYPTIHSYFFNTASGHHSYRNFCNLFMNQNFIKSHKIFRTETKMKIMYELIFCFKISTTAWICIGFDGCICVDFDGLSNFVVVGQLWNHHQTWKSDAKLQAIQLKLVFDFTGLAYYLYIFTHPSSCLK